MKYEIIYDRFSYVELRIEVNRWLKSGWKPQGGVSGNYQDGFIQAVVKEEEGDDKGT